MLTGIIALSLPCTMSVLMSAYIGPLAQSDMLDASLKLSRVLSRFESGILLVNTSILYTILSIYILIITIKYQILHIVAILAVILLT